MDKNEMMRNTLKAKILDEVAPEDICDFWAEMVNGYIKVDHTHTGKVSLECFDGFDVYDSIEDAAKDCVYTIVEWVVDGHDFALEWLEENGIELDAVAETASAPNYDFEKVTPDYTGGGIYIFSGKLTDGNYFLADGDMFDVSILDADAYENWEECFYAEWQEAHIVKNLSSAEALEFFKSMLTWIRVNEPKDCNYDMHDMDRIEEDLNEQTAEEEKPEVQFEELNIITRTFSVGGGFFVDVTVTDDWLGNGLVREAWLYHNSIDKKDMVLSGSVKGETEDEFLEILKGNLYDGNRYIDGYRETYMDSFKAYDEWKERI